MLAGRLSFSNRLGPMFFLPGGVLLYYLSRTNYLLFHGLVEIFGVIIVGGVAMITWNCRQMMRSHFLLFVGLGYLFVGLLGILHIFSYKGLSVFSAEYGENLPSQLRIAARYLESVTFLAATIFLSRRLCPGPVLAGFSIITISIVYTIFVWPIFPVCYVDGVGLTSFNNGSEFLIAAIWFVVIVILLSNRSKFDASVLQQLLLAISCDIIAGLSFTLDIDLYGFINFGGHFLGVIAAYFLYRAIIERSLSDPYSALFRKVNLSDQHFRSLYDTAPLAFVVWDKDCRVTQWNKTAEKIFGWSAAEVKGRVFFEFIVPEKDRPVIADVVAALRSGTLANHSIEENMTKGGGTITCEWNNSILLDKAGNFRRVLSLGLDITEKKKAEEMLQQQSEMIKHFAYSVAHDLNSPAIALSGLADLYQKKYGEALDDRGRLVFEQIKRISLQISNLAQNINTFVVAKELPLVLENIDMLEMLRQLQEEFSSRLVERKVTLVTPGNVPVMRADLTALQRILRNFIDNALKYGGEQLSRIEIGYRGTPGCHQLYVRDDGGGLPPEGEEKIFEIFQRGQTASGTSGAGLGLAIARELAEKMGGEVWYEQPYDHGAVFCTSIAKGL